MASHALIEAFLAEPFHAIVIGLRRDGRPQATPNWFFFDGERFYVSTTRHRAKYHVFRRDPRVGLVVDDCTGHRYVSLTGTVEIREDLEANVDVFRATREKYGVEVPDDATFVEFLRADGRVLLAITPDVAMSDWKTNGLDEPAAH